MILFYYFYEFPHMQKELYVIFFLPDLVFLVLLEVLVFHYMEKYWDIQRLVIRWVLPNNKRNKKEQPRVVELGLTFLLHLLDIL